MKPLREGFDSVSGLYDRVRPTYPEQLFDEMFSRLAKNPKIVEVGPGTGQATGALLRRGARVTAIELGANLAKRLRENFASDRHLEIVLSSFEGAELEGHAYDALVSATAYHWVGADVRLSKPSDVLRPGGWLAVIDSVQVQADSDQGFYERSHVVYDKFGDPDNRPSLPTPEQVTGSIGPELEQSSMFGEPLLFRYRWDQTYNTTQHSDLLRTYSPTIAMPQDQREAFVAEMAALVDGEFGGRVTRPLVIALTMAQSMVG